MKALEIYSVLDASISPDRIRISRWETTQRMADGKHHLSFKRA